MNLSSLVPCWQKGGCFIAFILNHRTCPEILFRSRIILLVPTLLHRLPCDHPCEKEFFLPCFWFWWFFHRKFVDTIVLLRWGQFAVRLSGALALTFLASHRLGRGVNFRIGSWLPVVAYDWLWRCNGLYVTVLTLYRVCCTGCSVRSPRSFRSALNPGWGVRSQPTVLRLSYWLGRWTFQY